jgi:hypothetical protein
VARDQRLELAGDVRVAADRDVRLDPVLQARQPQLLEVRALDACERLVELGQRRAAPHRQRLMQARGGSARVAGRERRPALVAQAGEAGDVDRFRREREHVAGRSRQQDLGRQHLAQLRHVELHHLDRRLRRVVAPEVVDEPLDRDGPVDVEHQPGEQRARPAAAELERHRAVGSLERSEDAELHCCSGQRYTRVSARARSPPPAARRRARAGSSAGPARG